MEKVLLYLLLRVMSKGIGLSEGIHIGSLYKGVAFNVLFSVKAYYVQVC